MSEDKKSEIIVVKMMPQDDSAPIDIKATKKTKVSKLISAWAQNKGISESSIRLFKDGVRISGANDQTLGDADLEDGDQLDVMIEQIGGSW